MRAYDISYNDKVADYRAVLQSEGLEHRMSVATNKSSHDSTVLLLFNELLAAARYSLPVQ